MAAEIHQRLLDEEKENQLSETKEKSPQMGANKKAKKEQPKKKKEDKKEKGTHGLASRNMTLKTLLGRKPAFNQAHWPLSH